MDNSLRARNVVMVLAGVAALLMKGWFRDSISDLIYSYLGNLSVSLSVYFLVSIAASAKLGRLGIAAVALAIVEIFEFADGFAVMTNVYDPFDYLANALGIALAICVDLASARIMEPSS